MRHFIVEGASLTRIAGIEETGDNCKGQPRSNSEQGQVVGKAVKGYHPSAIQPRMWS